MTFEYDENKSKSNKLKHGLDFNEAKVLWDDSYAFELPALEKRVSGTILQLFLLNHMQKLKLSFH